MLSFVKGYDADFSGKYFFQILKVATKCWSLL